MERRGEMYIALMALGLVLVWWWIRARVLSVVHLFFDLLFHLLDDFIEDCHAER